MNKQQRGFVVPLVIIIIAALLVTGGAYAYYQHATPTVALTTTPVPVAQVIPTPPTPATTAFTPATAAASSSLLTTYTSAQYGFSIGFPLSVETGKQFDWGQDVPDGTGVFLMAIPLQDGSNGFGTGQINLGFSTSTANVAGCVTLPYNGMQTFQPEPNVVVNGINFFHYGFYQPAAGQFQQVDSYRTIYNGACWAIDFSINGEETNRLYGTDLTKAQADYVQLQNEFDVTLQTFKFLAPGSTVAR